MESKSVSQSSPSTDNKPKFKCPDGWNITITKTDPSKIGTPFSKCGGSSGCSCVTEKSVEKTVESTKGAEVFCECPEGWSCVLTKTEGSEAGKTYFECGEGCACVIDKTNTVKVVCA